MSAQLIVSVQGQIVSCHSDNTDDIFCKFGFAMGSDWSIISGADEGISQTSKVGIDHCCTWNFPIDAVFQSPKPFGWPQLIVSVYGENLFGKTTVIGYGACHIPTEAGHHSFNVALFSRAPTPAERFTGFFTGRMPEAIAPNFIAGGDAREIFKTESHGYIKVSFDTVISGLQKLDLKIS
ncbi:B9 domain-containing protein 1 [Histomonas meleagridis]|uniref:B9 domain-containing protein 1 n=1 Tax=Histomonas meleagridis TaxID=135588 RepID=UPI00355A6BEE|nr:B9 domain-containing protein 1 [Histomonas meleagridis]